ncbi:AOX1 [Auxenochlorella protothecoides x Auxenochlorella symbiontica]
MLRAISRTLTRSCNAPAIWKPIQESAGSWEMRRGGATFLTRTFSAQPASAEKLSTPDPKDHSTYNAADNVMPHPGLRATASSPEAGGKDKSYWLMQPIYSKEYVESVEPHHQVPEAFFEKAGYYGVQAMRSLFDVATGYGHQMTEERWLRRILFLETVAGVPGFVAGMLRHMRSLRSMKRDRGWIHTLLEEAENERMHLLTFLQFREPGPLMRGTVLLGQGVFLNFYLLAYTISPRTCHSFVGYLEEEAVKTYTRCIKDLDAGLIPQWEKKALPEIAIKYWQLSPDATMRDLLLAVRADEACHSHVNHAFSHMKPSEENPFLPGTVHVP